MNACEVTPVNYCWYLINTVFTVKWLKRTHLVRVPWFWKVCKYGTLIYAFYIKYRMCMDRALAVSKYLWFCVEVITLHTTNIYWHLTDADVTISLLYRHRISVATYYFLSRFPEYNHRTCIFLHRTTKTRKCILQISKTGQMQAIHCEKSQKLVWKLLMLLAYYVTVLYYFISLARIIFYML